ncbi:MAG TPA: radical SAM/SPASM domain-containing protein [Candidatus Sulfotelmatobacter sp.]|nr:radical SAM/SPASM domain-containing protein [Candidatus Sulfotelmatobacter sp.]
MSYFNSLFLNKVSRVVTRKADALVGRVRPLAPTLESMGLRPFELHLELTNLCNADCVFCPYQFQQRKTEFMSEQVFEKAIADFVQIGGGSVGLTPIVGDALIDPHFLDRIRRLRAQANIDRIWLTTNAILLDKHGIQEVLASGITHMNISTAGFDEAMYVRVYRNKSYRRMRENVLELLRLNARASTPIPITIALRPDRPLDDVMRDPDFQDILAFHPLLDFTWAYTSANGRLKREALPTIMKLRTVNRRPESCVNLWNGPIVLPDGTVMACSCVAAMDALVDLAIGNVLRSSLLEIWQSQVLKQLRDSFGTDSLNKTCAGCDMYRDLEFYRTHEGRQRARINRARHSGLVQFTSRTSVRPFSGG